ncbi:MAG: acyl carrier protein [Deltaproteobacteria bacterium]
MDVMEELEKYLLNEVAVETALESLAPDDDLLMQGIIDSMGIVQLTEFMEKRFGIRVMDDEMVPENFQNLRALADFVERKARVNILIRG